MEIRGKENLERALDEKTITGPLSEKITKIVLWFQAHIMKSEPVVTGRLRSSITPQIEAAKFYGKVDTSVSYAPFVEYGHTSRGGTQVPPSRVSHGTSMRIRDIGAFTFAIKESGRKIGDWLKELSIEIQQRFG